MFIFEQTISIDGIPINTRAIVILTPRSIVIYCLLLKAELLYTYFIHCAEIDWQELRM